ncbi:MAG: T9SS type A sorting domain-containing protein [Bacteroidota bacterium]|nr:T9SS type A sorting domain-containing protein [Bacteroidota bacterium]
MKKELSFLIFGLGCIAQNSFSQRIVLIEQFTNSGCPPCAVSTPPVFNYVNNNPADVVAIGYHTSYPYSDSMYFENPVESSARVSYYGSFGVPQSFVDGNYYNNSSSNFLPVMASTINTRKAIANKYNISNVSTTINTNNLSTKIAFESLSASNINDTLRAHVVVIEKNVLKSSYAASPGANSETNYEYVMRKMLPNQNGSFLINRGLNGKDTITLNWAMQKIKNNVEVRIVAFVQNKNTKEVYMANMFSTNLSTGVDEINAEQLSFHAYSDPILKTITITSTKLKNTANIAIIDMSGKNVVSEKLTPGETIHLSTSSFNAGIYFIGLNDGVNFQSKKIIIE